jgi:hypothetical protein
MAIVISSSTVINGQFYINAGTTTLAPTTTTTTSTTTSTTTLAPTTTTSTTTTTTTVTGTKLSIEKFAIGDYLGLLTNYAYNNPIHGTISNTSANSLLVVTIGGGGDTAYPPSGQYPATASVQSYPALTWTRQVKAQPGVGVQAGDVEIWTAINPTGGTVGVSASWTGYNTTSPGVVETELSIYSLINYATAYIGNSYSLVISSAGAATGSISGSTNSIIIGLCDDWNAATPPPGGYTGPNITVDHESNYTSLGTMNFYYFHSGLTRSGTYTIGLTSPTDMQSGFGLLEIKSQ